MNIDVVIRHLIEKLTKQQGKGKKGKRDRGGRCNVYKIP